MKKKKKILTYPTIQQLEAELKRERYKHNYARMLRSTVFTLVTVAAIAVLVATLWLPVLQIYGNSMSPTLQGGSIVVSVKSGDLETGDIVAFYYNNNVLVKRVIAGPGDWVNVAEDGTVFVNGVELDEPYLQDKSFGQSNLEYPYQVPESRWFVMGDHRSVSVDSRHTAVGCVAEEQIVGELVFCVWPMEKFGAFDQKVNQN